MNTVAELRRAGWKVGVKHNRAQKLAARQSPFGGPLWQRAERGGSTVVYLTPPESERMFTALATCHPKDSYNRRLGLTIALGRALKQYHEENTGDSTA